MIKQPAKLTFEVPFKVFNYKMRINGFWLVVALTFVYVFVQLGQWQLSRAEEKRNLILTSEERLVSQPIPLTESNSAEIEDYQPVIFDGSHYQGILVYMANEPFQSRDGYHLYIPVELNSSKQLVWINLGWVPAYGDRRQLPDIKQISSKVSIEGYSYFSKGKPLLFEHALTQPKDNIWLLQGRDYELLFSVISERKNDTLPYIIRTTKKSDDNFIRDWLIVSMKPDKHIAYAVQWFGLAFTVGVVFMLLTIKRMGNSNDSE